MNSTMNNKNKTYLDKNIPIEERVEDLLSRMTLEEKVNQMCALGDFENMDIFKGGKMLFPAFFASIDDI